MKTIEEIEKLAEFQFPKAITKEACKFGFIKGYTKCQEDMALSQPKEIDLGELREEFDSDFTDNSGYIIYRTTANDMFNWILRHLQKPVESDEDKLLNFAKWYSGMEMSAVKRAYKRYLIENN